MLDFNSMLALKLHQMHKEKEITNIMNNINSAYKISQKILKSAYNSNGIKAGQTHFSDVWVRDSCFSSWGAIAINDHEIVENFLTVTLNHLNEKGQCPLRIGQKYFLLKFFGLKGPEGPSYIEDKYVSIPMDSNSLTIILFHKYLVSSQNHEFAQTFYSKLIKAIRWYENHQNNHLITEGHYAGWADSIKKKGHVLYTNVLYFKSLCAMRDISKHMNNHADEIDFLKKSESVKKRINEVFWNGDYLNDWVYKNKSKTTFSVDGNMLGILFNVIDEKKVSKVLNYVIAEQMITNVGVPVVHKKYNHSDVYSPFLLIGLKKYHNGLYWFWVSCITSIALFKNGFKKEGLDLLNKLSIKINKDQTVFEVYNKNGTPFNGLFYKSEKRVCLVCGSVRMGLSRIV